jgi:integrase/recombinase XerC
VEAAAAALFSQSHGSANKMALDFKNWMVRKGHKAATVNNRLAALRSLIDLGKISGVIAWNLDVKSVREEKYRDTIGPGIEKVRDKIKELRSKLRDPKACRDAAILALMGIMALRRGEVVGLNLEDLEEDRLFMLGKGRSDQEPYTVPPQVLQILQTWIGHRGKHPGPLFVHFRQKRLQARLSGRSVGRITNKLGLGNAHGLRHAAITEALELNNGDVRKVAKFSRHKNIQTLLKYDDNRRDLGGEVAKGLANELGQ